MKQCARWFSLFACLACPASVPANMAAPRPDLAGAPAGDVIGLTPGIIEREELVIDLRPVAGGDPARVQATYHVRYSAPARTQRLVFVAGTPLGPQASVLFDGQTVPIQLAEGQNLPASWRPPASTPGIDGGPLWYVHERPSPTRLRPVESVGKQTVIDFSVPLTPGEHVLRVEYQAQPSAYMGRDTARCYWQFVYILAPALDWERFDDLELTVLLPVGWRVASDPEMARGGDILRGSFRTLPADAIALTFQKPAHWTVYLEYALLATCVFGNLLLGPALLLRLARRVGRKLAQQNRSAFGAVPVSMVGGAAWAAAWVGTALLWTLGAREWIVPDSQISANYSDGTIEAFLWSVVAIVIALPVGTILTQVATVLVWRRVCVNAVVAEPRNATIAEADVSNT